MMPVVCQRCGGPCRVHAGSVHGWTCRRCLSEYVQEQPDPPSDIAKRAERKGHG